MMQSSSLIRIDYVPVGVKCVLCHRELEMAHVVSDYSGTELFYGSECVKKLKILDLNKQVTKVPNLTLRGGHSERDQNSVQHNQNYGESRNDEAKRAAEYLWLRMDKVASLSPDRKGSLLWEPLVEKFRILKSSGLISDADARMILSTEAKAPPELKRINLLDVYSAACQLERKLKLKHNDYFDSLLSQLKSKLRLSQAQLNKAEIHLPPTAFGWYVPPKKD